MNTKETNPKDGVGIRKAPSSVVSQAVMAEVGLAMLEGALKYGRHNFREAGVRASVYYDATRRHIDHWWEGEDIDPDSEISHITKAIASLMVLRDAMIQDKVDDDRPPPSEMDWPLLDKRAADLMNRYQGRDVKHVTAKNIQPDGEGGPPPSTLLTPPPEVDKYGTKPLAMNSDNPWNHGMGIKSRTMP